MVRSFSGVPPAPAVLERVLAAALRAPSAGNTQGWDAVVLQGTETARFWDATTTDAWREQARRWPGPRRAPVVVAVFTDPGAYVERYRQPDKADDRLGTDPGSWPVPYWFVDGGMAVQLLLLAAVDHGLGACFLGNFRGEGELAAELGVPLGRRYLGAVLLGEPEGDDPPSPSLRRSRRTFEDVVHFGSW